MLTYWRRLTTAFISFNIDSFPRSTRGCRCLKTPSLINDLTNSWLFVVIIVRFLRNAAKRVRSRFVLTRNTFYRKLSSRCRKSKLQKQQLCSRNTRKTKVRQNLATAITLHVFLRVFTSDDSDTDDSDFEEVQSKDGFEADIPEHLKLFPNSFETSRPSTSKAVDQVQRGFI